MSVYLDLVAHFLQFSNILGITRKLNTAKHLDAKQESNCQNKFQRLDESYFDPELTAQIKINRQIPW